MPRLRKAKNMHTRVMMIGQRKDSEKWDPSDLMYRYGVRNGLDRFTHKRTNSFMHNMSPSSNQSAKVTKMMRKDHRHRERIDLAIALAIPLAVLVLFLVIVTGQKCYETMKEKLVTIQQRRRTNSLKRTEPMELVESLSNEPVSDRSTPVRWSDFLHIGQ